MNVMLLTKEKEELEDENNRLRRLKYISQANISTYTDIDSFIRDNITNISPTTSNWTTDTTIPTINVYTYDGDGSVEYNPQTSSSSEQLYNPNNKNFEGWKL